MATSIKNNLIILFFSLVLVAGCQKKLSYEELKKNAYSEFNRFCKEQKINNELLGEPKVQRFENMKLWMFEFMTKPNPHDIVIVNISDTGHAEISWDKREDAVSPENKKSPDTKNKK